MTQEERWMTRWSSSTSGITEIGIYGHTEKPEGLYDGYTECCIAAEIRIYGIKELRKRKAQEQQGCEFME